MLTCDSLREALRWALTREPAVQEEGVSGSRQEEVLLPVGLGADVGPTGTPEEKDKGALTGSCPSREGQAPRGRNTAHSGRKWCGVIWDEGRGQLEGKLRRWLLERRELPSRRISPISEAWLPALSGMGSRHLPTAGAETGPV